jgi:NADH dehydrogenase
MKIAITGASGLIGRALAHELAYAGHELVLIARGSDGRERKLSRVPHAVFVPASITDEDALVKAFAGCEAVAHCAGINRELGPQTYERVHVEGTQAVVRAAQRAGVGRIAMISFLRARASCGSGYHESKWEAEEIVRVSGLIYTILKCGIVYGRGDHLLDHISHTLYCSRLFATVGIHSAAVAPAAVEDVARLLVASLAGGRLPNETVAVTGPERLEFGEVVRRIARAAGRRVLIVPMPIWFHRLLARVLERVMKVPLISVAQVKILSESVTEPLPGTGELPEDLRPWRRFTVEQIRRGLPDPGGFGMQHLRC